LEGVEFLGVGEDFHFDCWVFIVLLLRV